ncbi:MAG: DinB family protein [Acidobacteriota bacterium]|nr:DinB family protein [Acidobacteriota bacterium]
MVLNPYASDLDAQEPIPILTSTSERLHALTAPLSGAEINRSPAPGKWSICALISHLADCEIVFSFRLRQAAAEEHALIQPFDQDAWAARYTAYHLAPALALFDAARTWNLLFLTTISQDDRHRPTTHPERGTMTLWTIVETMAGHDIHHLRQLESLTSHRPQP